MIKNLLLLVILLVGIVAGWFAGSWSGRQAKEALAKVEEAGRALEAEHRKQVDDLNARMATLTSDYARDKQALDAAHAQKLTEMNTILAGTKGRVVELEKARSASQTQLAQLKAQRDAATTPQARKDIDARITAAEGVVNQQSIAIVSEQCLTTPVPSAVLASWNGK